jgi:hypothetical protein
MLCSWLTECTVMHQTGLERDLQLLEAGDATEVGEKGITLRHDIHTT